MNKYKNSAKLLVLMSLVAAPLTAASAGENTVSDSPACISGLINFKGDQNVQAIQAVKDGLKASESDTKLTHVELADVCKEVDKTPKSMSASKGNFGIFNKLAEGKNTQNQKILGANLQFVNMTNVSQKDEKGNVIQQHQTIVKHDGKTVAVILDRDGDGVADSVMLVGAAANDGSSHTSKNINIDLNNNAQLDAFGMSELKGGLNKQQCSGLKDDPAKLLAYIGKSLTWDPSTSQVSTSMLSWQGFKDGMGLSFENWGEHATGIIKGVEAVINLASTKEGHEQFLKWVGHLNKEQQDAYVACQVEHPGDSPTAWAGASACFTWKAAKLGGGVIGHIFTGMGECAKGSVLARSDAEVKELSSCFIKTGELLIASGLGRAVQEASSTALMIGENGTLATAGLKTVSLGGKILDNVFGLGISGDKQAAVRTVIKGIDKDIEKMVAGKVEGKTLAALTESESAELAKHLTSVAAKALGNKNELAPLSEGLVSKLAKADENLLRNWQESAVRSVVGKGQVSKRLKFLAADKKAQAAAIEKVLGKAGTSPKVEQALADAAAKKVKVTATDYAEGYAQEVKIEADKEVKNGRGNSVIFDKHGAPIVLSEKQTSAIAKVAKDLESPEVEALAQKWEDSMRSRSPASKKAYDEYMTHMRKILQPIEDSGLKSKEEIEQILTTCSPSKI